MFKSKVLPSLKTYLFFAVVSLFASAGCDLDIDFGGGDGSGGVSSEETITGSVREVIPSVEDGVSGLFIRFTSDDGDQTYSDSTDSRGDFSVNGNLDPGGRLEVFETEGADSDLGSRRFTVFPGATLNIEDISVRRGVLELAEDVRITFRGRVSDKNCDNETGTLNVEIEGRNADVLVQVTTATDIDIRTIEEPGCDEIVDGDKVRIDGVLEEGENVRATSIDVE